VSERFAPRLAGGAVRAPSSELALVEWGHPGGPEPPHWIAPLHVHHDDDEAWYVLQGALCVRLGDETLEVPAGGAILAPRGTPHAYGNATETPARYVLVATPRIFDLIEALHSPGARDYAAIFRAHRSELLG
jgi:mannose-6-phosphate isomerase-like protein (cupin superfamily)